MRLCRRSRGLIQPLNMPAANYCCLMIRLDSVGVNAARFAPNIMTSWQICRERSCAVPFGRVAEGVKPLPYERSHSRAREAGYGDLPFNISIGDLRLVRVRGLPTRAFSAGVLRERPERSRRKSRLPRPSNDCRVDALPELGLAVTDQPSSRASFLSLPAKYIFNPTVDMPTGDYCDGYCGESKYCSLRSQHHDPHRTRDHAVQMDVGLSATNASLPKHLYK